jgi:RNase P/RNase MRP subunit p29
MIVRVKRKNGEVVKVYGKVIRGELVEETDTHFVVRRDDGLWEYSKENALYEPIRKSKEVV